MSNNDDSFDRFRKRQPSRDPFFRDINEMFHEIEKMMDEELENFTERVPKEYIKERKLPDGSTAKELGPFVYGYSMKIGPDGKPEIQEFGNLKKANKGPPQIKEEREPLIDIVETDSEIRVVAELPGVEKTDIKLRGTEDSLEISVDSEHYKYYKEVKLPAKVQVKEASSTYKNGVLEVVLPKDSPSKPKGEPINVG